MIQWRFHIDDLEISEPIGFDEITLEINRGDNWHGVFFEASTSDLRFYGAAADYLIEKKETLGLKSQVIFKAESRCEGEMDYTVVLQGKLNFGRYKKTCGNNCMVSMNVEQENCTMTMRNRYDQKVEIERTTAFDNLQALAVYDKLNFDMDLPAKDLLIQTKGTVLPTNDVIHYPSLWIDFIFLAIRPSYGNELYNSINTGQLKDPTSNIQYDAAAGGPLMSPQLLLEENIFCLPSGLMSYNIRLKGHISLTGKSPGEDKYFSSWHLMFVEYKADDGGAELGMARYPNLYNTPTLTELESESHILPGWMKVVDEDFDVTWTGTLTPKAGYGYYAFVDVNTSVDLKPFEDFEFTVTFHPETSFDMSANKSCPSTTSKVSAIHETLSRVSEAITNNCLKVKSDYYGRTDSQPYTALLDGCGGLRVLTNGLHIRKDANAKFFVSLKELYEGLKAIDNIGMGIEPNPNITGFDWLRIEDVNYFYQDVEILSLPFVPHAEEAIDEPKHYSLIKVGYKKWEVENVNGLDEPNSNKEYRTSLSSVNNTLDITSNLISGSYPIEITRQQSFAVSGGADTKYDNEIFIICVDRAAYGFNVEQGNISGLGPYAAPANVYSPETLYNWRIRPYYNLMRWFKSIVNSYPNLVDPDNKLFFSAGTGNYLAEGELIDGPYDASGCKLENGPKAENDDLGILDFLNEVEGTPIDKPETIRLKYPLSIREYKLIKAKPYGYISVGCNPDGSFIKGFIKQITYKPTKGEADFLLKLKWQ